ncbi:MAG: Biopolymer transport protein ExbD [Syntrophorhabdus sp. PtaU1.Bin153]|nr:MAG: Biopolymer transport protein ExbD [Syntrophorhabdus sp. PtaU1.Bin153]
MKADKGSGPLSDINIIPFVDVMLVLLIIFMITSPMMQHGIGVEVPKVTAKPLPTKDEAQVVTVTKYRQLLVNDKTVNLDDLKPTLQFIFANRDNREILLRADSSVAYGLVAQCMALIREAGVEKISLVTKPIDEN